MYSCTPICAFRYPNPALFVSAKVPRYDKSSLHGADLKRVTVVLPLEVHKALKLRGIELDITMNDQILAAVKQYLSESGSEKSDLSS